MAKFVLIDVDIALKACNYRSQRGLLACTTIDQPPALLSIGRFSLRNRVRTAKNLKDPSGLKEAIEDLIANIRLVEPTSDEINMAAEFEEEAARCFLEFDTGESQLLAILLHRNASLLLTGDKRAIQAVHGLGVQGVDGRIACLEQLIATILGKCDYQEVRERVCGEPCVDIALTSCFACTALEVSEEDIQVGLASYVGHLRRSTGALLLPSSDLSAVIP